MKTYYVRTLVHDERLIRVQAASLVQAEAAAQDLVAEYMQQWDYSSVITGGTMTEPLDIDSAIEARQGDDEHSYYGYTFSKHDPAGRGDE